MFLFITISFAWSRRRLTGATSKFWRCCSFGSVSTCQLTIETWKEDYTTINDFGSRLKDVERSGIVMLDTKGRILFSCRMDPCWGGLKWHPWLVCWEDGTSRPWRETLARSNCSRNCEGGNFSRLVLVFNVFLVIISSTLVIVLSKC